MTTPMYEYAIGRTIESILDVGNTDQGAIRISFTDGTYLDIRGIAFGTDVEYEGLWYEFVQKD